MRRRSRECALQMLFQLDDGSALSPAEDSGVDMEVCDEAIRRYWDSFTDGAKVDIEFAERLVRGVAGELAQVHDALSKAAENWKLSRMEKVDRNILRLAAYEILYCADIPTNVSINEALEVTKRFSGTPSVSFVNGVLDKLAAGAQ